MKRHITAPLLLAGLLLLGLTGCEDDKVFTADGNSSVVSDTSSDAGSSTDSKTDSKTDSQTDSDTDSKADSQTDSKTVSMTESKSDPKTTSGAESKTGGTPASGTPTSYADSRARKLMESMDGSELTMHLVITSDMLGSTISQDMFVTYNASNVYLDMTMTSAGETVKITMVNTNGKVYALNHTDKTYTITDGDGEIDNLRETIVKMFETGDGEDPVLTDTGSKTVDGIACVYETYKDNSDETDATTIQYFFSAADGSFVKMIGTNNETGEAICTLDQYSEQADTTKFVVPDYTGYQPADTN